MTSWTTPPGPSDGNWKVYLPPDSSVGELIVYAGSPPPPTDPWDLPDAPASTTVSVASTYIVTGSQISGGGDSFLIPSGSFALKVIFRVDGTPPPATVTTWIHTWHADFNDDGSYGNVTTSSSAVGGWTWYGPGDTTSDGLAVPADAASLYITGYSVRTCSAVARR
jgi:hypothetical protein